MVQPIHSAGVRQRWRVRGDRPDSIGEGGPEAREPEAPYDPGGDRHEPPAVELRPYTPEELWRLFRGGELEADAVEARLVRAARARCGLWLRIVQWLRALQQGRRLQELAFRFADYARELRVGRSRGYELAAFAEDLETRPLLREAVRSGRVRYRAAQEVMPLAVGEAEARWVEKPLPAPDVDFDAMTSAQEIDRELRRLVRQDQEWDEIVGHDEHALERGTEVGTRRSASPHVTEAAVTGLASALRRALRQAGRAHARMR